MLYTYPELKTHRMHGAFTVNDLAKAADVSRTLIASAEKGGAHTKVKFSAIVNVLNKNENVTQRVGGLIDLEAVLIEKRVSSTSQRGRKVVSALSLETN